MGAAGGRIAGGIPHRASNPEAVIEKMAAESTGIASLTITEGA